MKTVSLSYLIGGSGPKPPLRDVMQGLEELVSTVLAASKGRLATLRYCVTRGLNGDSTHQSL